MGLASGASMLEIPFETNLIIYISFVLLVLGILSLLVFFLNRIRRTVERVRHKEIKRISLTQHTFRFILVLLWILVSATTLFLSAFIQSYQSFTKKELTAIVRCVPLGDDVDAMQMELTFIKNGRIEDYGEFILKGDQWALEGNILKWRDWLNFAGLHTMYKLTRVRGRFVNIQDEISHSPSVYSLVKGEDDPKWRWLYKYGHKLPFVTAVYGNTVFTYPAKEKGYEIYVTTSGFMAQIQKE